MMRETLENKPQGGAESECQVATPIRTMRITYTLPAVSRKIMIEF
jgi:hypothetical protein